MPAQQLDSAPGAARTPGPVSLAVALSGLRCTLTYLLLPGLAPLLGSVIDAALPIVVALHALGIWASARATWRSASRDRWGAATVASFLLSVNLMSTLVLLA